MFSFVNAESTTYMGCGEQIGIPYDLPGFVREILNIIKIFVPIILIIIASVDLIKVVVSGENEAVSKAVSKLIKRSISAASIFFVVTLVQLLMNLLGRNTDSFMACFSCFISDGNSCYTYEVEKEDHTSEKEAADKAREELKKKREEQRKKNKEEADKKKEENKNTNSQPNNNKKGTKTIYIGDSRTVGMCTSLGGSSNNCQFSSGGAYKFNNNEIFIAQTSKGYSWFESTALPAVNKILTNDPNTTYNIVSYMGVNYLLSDVDKYVVKYKELANSQWKKHNIIIVSVNPVDEAKEKQHGYSTKQADIVKFNTKIKATADSLSNAYYCDTYNSIINNFSTRDGIHYTSDTYKKIYNATKACISNSGS